MILADQICRMISPGKQFSAIRDSILSAKRFVLDEAMSAYTADLGLAPLCSRSPLRRCEILDEMRKLARLPFKTTWIEMNFHSYMRRSTEEYGTYGVHAGGFADMVAYQPETKEPKYLGWLIQQHPQIETAFKATWFSSRCSRYNEGASPFTGPVGFAWCSGNEPLPWPPYDFRTPDGNGLGQYPTSGILTDLINYHSPQLDFVTSIDVPSDAVSAKEMDSWIVPMAGDARKLWALLASSPIFRRRSRTSSQRPAGSPVIGQSFRSIRPATQWPHHTYRRAAVPARRHALQKSRARKANRFKSPPRRHPACTAAAQHDLASAAVSAKVPRMFGWSKVATGDGEGKSAKAVLPGQLTLALVVGILVLAAYASASTDGVKTFVLLFVVSGAAFWIGALVGFLFGIPKSRTDGSSRLADARSVEGKGEGGTPREKYRDNANLEEVSDWLTKIIVGIGLVEFTKLLDFFGEVGRISEPIIGPYGKIVLQGSLLYFLVLGFIFCYLWTRVVFYEFLVSGEYVRQAVRLEVKEELKEEVVGFKTKSDEELGINRILNDLYVAIDVARNKERATRDWGILNQLNAQAKDIFNKNKLNRKAAILTARFIRLIQHDRTDPAGNAQAIHCLDEFLDAKRIAGQHDRDYAIVLYNRACYSATIAASIAASAADNGEMIRRKKKALADLQEAVQLAPDLAKLASADRDFKELLNDPDFKKMIAAPCL